jgi:calpain, invertebrate
VDVVVDDLLPYWPNGELVFCSNKSEPHEMWGPLLEKAYAKLYGSYENLEGGQTNDALIDLSGGIQENYTIVTYDYQMSDTLWQNTKKAIELNSITGCFINPDPKIKEARLSNGLVKGHAYTITKIAETTSRERLIRLRNPWGDDFEWKGAWSDKSHEWQTLSDNEKKELGIVIDNDGEFWMSFHDFLENMDGLQICHLTLDAFTEELLEKDDDSDIRWHCETYQGEWIPGINAGGSGKGDRAKFWTNPQFLVKLTEDVDTDDNENKVTLIVALMQKNTRLRRKETGNEASEEFIQFRLFALSNQVNTHGSTIIPVNLDSNQLTSIDNTGNYKNTREVTKRFRLAPGNYVIIPSTFEPDRQCEFMLRVFTEKQIEAKYFIKALFKSIVNMKDDDDDDFEFKSINVKKFLGKKLKLPFLN